MTCPSCRQEVQRTKETPQTIIDSRPAGDAIRRRRVCPHCGERFTTYELKSLVTPGKAGPGRPAKSALRKRDLQFTASWEPSAVMAV